jgi:hypothetical protein
MFHLSIYISAAVPRPPEFIVMFKEHATEEQIKNVIDDIHANGEPLQSTPILHIDRRYDGVVTSTGGQVGSSYMPLLKGFAAAIPQSYLQSNLQGDELIDYIGECDIDTFAYCSVGLTKILEQSRMA